MCESRTGQNSRNRQKSRTGRKSGTGSDRMAETAVRSGAHLWESSYPPDIDWHAEIPAAPLYRLMEEAVEQFADRPCIDFMDKRYTYAEIGVLVNRAARGFQALGV